MSLKGNGRPESKVSEGRANRKYVCAFLRVCTSLFFFSWRVELSVRARLRTGHLFPEERTFESEWNGRGPRYRLRCTPGVGIKFGCKSVTHNPQVTFDRAMPCHQKVPFKGIVAQSFIFRSSNFGKKKRKVDLISCLLPSSDLGRGTNLAAKTEVRMYELRLKAKQRKTALLSLLPTASLTVLVTFTLHLHRSAQRQVSNEKKFLLPFAFSWPVLPQHKCRPGK